jgi:hypothetical protein
MNSTQLIMGLVVKIIVNAIVVLLFWYEMLLAAFLVASLCAILTSSRLLSDLILNRTIFLKTKYLLGFDPKYIGKDYSLGWIIIRLLAVGGLCVTINLSNSNLQTIHPWYTILQYILFLFVALTKLSRELNQLRIPTCLPIILNPIRCQPKLSNVIGMLHKFTLMPLLLAAYSVTICSLIPTSSSNTSLLGVWRGVMVSYSFTHLSHSPERAAVDICLNLAMITWIPPQNTWYLWWQALDFGSQIFLVRLAKNVWFRFLDKSRLWVSLLYHFFVSLTFHFNH